MAEDIYSKLDNQPKRYNRRQFINDIKLLKKRQQELARNEDNYNNYFQKEKKTKRKLVNIVKLPASNNVKKNKRRFHRQKENFSEEYLEKKRIQNKDRIAKIQNNLENVNRYKNNTPSNLNIVPQNNIKIKIKTPKKVRRTSPKKNFILNNNYHVGNIKNNQISNNIKNLPKSNKDNIRFKKIKTRKKIKKRIVSPMYFKRYNIKDENKEIIQKNQMNSNVSSKTQLKTIPVNETKSQNKKLNQKRMLLKRQKFKSRKIKIKKNTNVINTEDIRNKLNNLPYKTLVNILYKEKLVKENTRAPKKLLIDLLLAMKIDCINIYRNYM